MTNSINLCELTESQLKLVIGGSNPFEAWNNCLKAAGFPTGSGGATCGSSGNAGAVWNNLLGQNGYPPCA